MSLSQLASTQKLEKAHGENFDLVHTGAMSDLLQFTLKHPAIEREAKGKLFLKDHLALTGMQVSLNVLPAGISVPFYHKHRKNEELYIFIKGKGQIQVDGQSMDVREGTCVRISPDGERTWKSSSSEDLYYIVIQARENSLEEDTFEDGIAGDRAVQW